MADQPDERRKDYKRKPWRREILAVALLVLTISVLGWLKVGGVAQDIQDSRLEVCEDTNDRHDSSDRTLNEILDAAAARHPERQRQIDQSRVTTALLINALVPVRDCEEAIK